MRKWLKQWIFLLFCLLLLPVSVYAVDAPHGIDPVEETLAPQQEGDPELSLCMPMMAIYDAETGSYPFYVEITGMQPDTGLWLEACLLDKQQVTDTAEGLLREAGQGAGLWLRFSAEKGTKSMRITLYADAQKTLPLYSATVRVALVEQLAFAQGDANAGVQRTVISLQDRQAVLRLYFPENTVQEDVQLQLADGSGAPCDCSITALTITDGILMEDARFDGIFKGENPYRVAVQQVEATISFPQPLDVGLYDLKMLDEQQTVLHTYVDLLECSGQPVVEILSWAEGALENHDNSDLAAIQLRLTAGAPEDFSVALYRGKQLLGTSAQWRVEDVGGWRQSAVVTYRIPLEEPLQENGEYRVKVSSDLPFWGENTALLSPFEGAEWVLDARNTVSDSLYFACFTLPSAGFTAGEGYRAQLLEDGVPVATMLASPDANGLFELAFTTETGEPLPLKQGSRYRVSLSRWTADGWQLCAAESVEAQASFQPDDGTVTALGTVVRNKTLCYGLQTEEEDNALSLQLFAPHATADEAAAVLRWDAGDQVQITDLASQLSTKPLQAVAFAEGIPAAVFPSAYWLSETLLQTLAQDTQGRVVQVSCGDNGTVALYCDGQSAEEGVLPALSQIYVHAVPAEGYEVAELQVNQQPITGRSFLLTGHTQVDVTFRKSTMQTFSVQLEYDAEAHHDAGGSVAVSCAQAAVEARVVLTAEVRDGYCLERLDVQTESGALIPLTSVAGGWQFSMPGEPVRVIAAIRPLYQPEISVCINNAYGTLIAPQTAVEGQLVTVQAIPHAASSLESLTLVYRQEDGQRQIDLLPNLVAQHRYRFSVPAADALTIAAVFAQPPIYTVGGFVSECGSVTASVSAAVPTEPVWLTVTPETGFRMVPDTLAAQYAVNGQLQTLPLEQNGEDVWFSMPWGDVSLSAQFEPIPAAAAGGKEISTGQQLLEALGGADNARLREDGVTVELLQTVELQSPLVFIGGDLTLDTGTAFVLAAGHLTDAPVQVKNSARLTLTGGAGGVDACRAQQSALLVSGGMLKIQGGSYRGICGLHMTEDGRLLLQGGTFEGRQAALRLADKLANCLDRHVLALCPETGTAYDAAWTEQRELADSVRFQQAKPAVCEQALAAQRTSSDRLTVAVPVERATGDALLLAAVYDAEGRMLGVAQMPCIRGAVEHTLSLQYSGIPQRGTVFLLDGLSFDPQMQSIPVWIP